MGEKRQVNRRTKLQIAEANAMKTLTAAGIPAESEEGRKLLEQVRENIKNTQSNKIDPALSKAKKDRLTAKRTLEKLNTAAKTLATIQASLDQDAITSAIADFNAKNNEVKELGGDEIVADTEALKAFMNRNTDEDAEKIRIM